MSPGMAWLSQSPMIALKMDGSHSNGCWIMEEWDFRSMNAQEFKKRFEYRLAKPVSELLAQFRANPNVTMPVQLQASIVGIVSAFAEFISVILSHSDSQKQTTEPLSLVYPENIVGLLEFDSVQSFRKACLDIVCRKITHNSVFRSCVRVCVCVCVRCVCVCVCMCVCVCVCICLCINTYC